jgi:hypothetical protein
MPTASSTWALGSANPSWPPHHDALAAAVTETAITATVI